MFISSTGASTFHISSQRALLAFVIVSGNFARLMLHDVGVQLRFPDHIFAGEKVHLAVTLANRKQLLPSVSVTVEANARRTADSPPAPGKARTRDEAAAAIRRAIEWAWRNGEGTLSEDLHDLLDRELFRFASDECDDNQSQMAGKLGLSWNTVSKKLKEYRRE